MNTTTARPSPIDPNDNTAPINLNDNRTNPLTYISNTVKNTYSTVINTLNPFNYITSSVDNANNFKIFMQKQENPVTANFRLYPFTEINPYLPWYKQLKVSMIGESISESLQRFKDREMCDHLYNSLKVSRGKFTSVVGITPATTATSTPTP
jgi:hypothetical protein